jgi:CRISPR-associated endonuclease/helicase Cas3
MTSGDPAHFNLHFEQLTGFAPLSWQKRLYADHFREGTPPGGVDIPTGLGKTSIIALWLIARACGAKLPRRLVYVVDRRAVVDQATEFVEALRQRLDEPDSATLKQALGLENRSLPISTLRGQHVDNREWLEDPSLPAVVVGTVDLVGSRLLFEGYGVSRKMRPYHAGLMGVDTLVILDEAHLVPAFESLLESVDSNGSALRPADPVCCAVVPGFYLLSLSATGRKRDAVVFRLRGSFEQPSGQREDCDDEVVAKRLQSRKGLAMVRVEGLALEQGLAREAWRLTENGRLPIRCLVYCNERDTAEKVKNEIERLAKGVSKGGSVPIHEPLLFVGARRVREREQVASELRSLGFLAGNPVELERPAFLIATSAGEVGVDLDADHMVCDLVAWERMVQRLGRVNRRGDGDARVVVMPKHDSEPNESVAAAFKVEDGKRSAKQKKEVVEFERIQTFRAPIECLPRRADDGLFDASPEALRQIKLRAATQPGLGDLIERATTQPPLRPALTRALVDAWSMTSLERHTGRPLIDPWLRGWVEDPSQTKVLWRNHLPVRAQGAPASDKEVETFFEAAPPHAGELLETETFRVVDWLKQRIEAMRRSDDLIDILGFVFAPTGELHALRTQDFLCKDEKQAKEWMQRQLTSAVLVLDARVRGLAMGLLKPEAQDPVLTADGIEPWLPLLPDGQPVVRFRVTEGRATELGAQDSNWLERYRFVVERSDEGEHLRWLVVEKWASDSTNETDRSVASHPQLLGEHQSWAEEAARRLAIKLGLTGVWEDVLAIAARLHDEGKRHWRWQRAFKAPTTDAPYAKTRGPVNISLLDGYRHEFGSLRYAEQDTAFASLADDLKDLVLHLIAAHHGQARPVISTRGGEERPSDAEARARDVALRFARLQKRWGPWGLAWWEALLRAADQQASRRNDQRNGEGI